MVWSLSKDDDGLESVPPSSPDGSPQRPAASALIANVAPGGGTARVEQNVAPEQGSSVVVDPLSSVPDGRAPAAVVRRKSVEATEVLQGRKIDELRAEVSRQRLAHRKKKRRVLLLWSVAGASALALGWLAGFLFSPGEPGSSGSAAPVSPPVARPSRVDSPPVASSPQPVPRAPDPVPRAPGTLSLSDLPAEDEPSPPTPSGPRSNSEIPGAQRPSTGPGSGRVLTLDDLPAQ
jgi:hypothetical protein